MSQTNGSSVKSPHIHARRNAGGAHRSSKAKLVHELIERMRRDANSPEIPLIAISHIPPSKTVHILVVWDNLGNLDTAERNQVITDAFAAAFPEQENTVPLPIGVTASEGFSMGYLPYQIQPLVRKEDHVSARQIDRAMKEAGGVLLTIGSGKQLRFSTRGQAEEAYRRLLGHINAPIWTLVEEVPSN